jgi:ubiquinone/menaquinone biosynthesis C-methylase UbiE
MHAKWLMVVAAAAALASFGAAVAWKFAFFVAPYAWTGEADRLKEVLEVVRGAHLADIGAGDGSLAIEMARAVGPEGVVYASDIDPEARNAIAARAERTGTRQIRVVAAAADATNLPRACCDAIYLRAVFHHLDDHSAFARSIVEALRPRGRVAIIDFPPGALWFHGADHGVTRAAVVAAFSGAGLSLTREIEDWGGGMFLLVFERPGYAGHVR